MTKKKSLFLSIFALILVFLLEVVKEVLEINPNKYLWALVSSLFCFLFLLGLKLYSDQLKEEVEKKNGPEEDERIKFIKYRANYRASMNMKLVWGTLGYFLSQLKYSYDILIIIFIVLTIESLLGVYYFRKYEKIY